MTNKLNLAVVEKYSKEFASKICEDFFANKEGINGKEVLNFSKIKQVNLLIIRELYEKWCQETALLRSPYFNFEESEVQAALKHFMNILSQHIFVKRASFEPIVAKAARETLCLTLSPDSFFNETFRDLPNFKLTQDDIKQLEKYVQINKNLLPAIEAKLAGREYVFVNEAIDWLKEIVPNSALDDINPTLQQFDNVLRLPDDMIEVKQANHVDNQEIIPKKVPESTSFFDHLNVEETLPKVEINESRFEPRQLPIVMAKDEELSPNYAEKSKEDLPHSVVDTYAVLPKEIENVRLNEHFAPEQKSLNDQTKQQKTVGDFHQTMKIEGISKVISLNQQFLFTNHLFGGDASAFQQALYELEQCPNFKEAKSILLKNYVQKYNWDITSAESEEFIDILKRRFH